MPVRPHREGPLVLTKQGSVVVDTECEMVGDEIFS